MSYALVVPESCDVTLLEMGPPGKPVLGSLGSAQASLVVHIAWTSSQDPGWYTKVHSGPVVAGPSLLGCDGGTSQRGQSLSPEWHIWGSVFMAVGHKQAGPQAPGHCVQAHDGPIAAGNKVTHQGT